MKRDILPFILGTIFFSTVLGCFSAMGQPVQEWKWWFVVSFLLNGFIFSAIFLLKYFLIKSRISKIKEGAFVECVYPEIGILEGKILRVYSLNNFDPKKTTFYDVDSISFIIADIHNFKRKPRLREGDWCSVNGKYKKVESISKKHLTTTDGDEWQWNYDRIRPVSALELFDAGLL